MTRIMLALGLIAMIAFTTLGMIMKNDLVAIAGGLGIAGCAVALLILSAPHRK